MICNMLVLWGWSVINPGVSSGDTSNSTILPQGYRTGHGHDLAGIAPDPTSSLCPSRRWGRDEPGELATYLLKCLLPLCHALIVRKDKTKYKKR